MQRFARPPSGTPSGWRGSLPSPKQKHNAGAPRNAAVVVIMIGQNYTMTAGKIASRAPYRLSLRLQRGVDHQDRVLRCDADRRDHADQRDDGEMDSEKPQRQHGACESIWMQWEYKDQPCRKNHRLSPQVYRRRACRRSGRWRWRRDARGRGRALRQEPQIRRRRDQDPRRVAARSSRRRTRCGSICGPWCCATTASRAEFRRWSMRPMPATPP